MNARQSQMIAFAYIAEKIAQGQKECSLAADSGIDMPECFKGWFMEYEDFQEWLLASSYKGMLSKDAGQAQEECSTIFYQMQMLLGIGEE